MARGGARPGAGRKRGTTGIKLKERQSKVQKMQAEIAANIPEAFEGDAHAFLVSVYKDPGQEFKDRLAAATAAAPYEKPKLAAVESKVDATVDGSLTVTRIELVAADVGQGDEHATH
jgi:hypothetical protein